ncbi:hypothetical protein [Flavobacterium sp.]|uniref:hypothetical protein n=1 Tax=Flavobacterium sp. TaxID=239 RepID=UPI003799F85D
MKTLKLITLGIVMLFATNSIHAQISVNLHLGTAPSWGPAGYDSANYYYLPDIEAYYDIRESQFIYLNRGTWIRSKSLPRQYRNYDLNSGYKVVLNDYHGSRPYTNFRSNRVQYHKGYQGSPQRTIGNNRAEHGNNDNRGNNGDRGGRGNNGRGNDKH